MQAALRCPKAADLVVSPAHRLLAIALRRGYLQEQNGSTVSELLASNKYRIMIKPQYQNQYIFLSDPAARDSPDTTPAPMTVSQLDEFLRAQCNEIGIATPGIKMKSFRRGALIDLESRVRIPTAHMMLDEKPKGWQPKWYRAQHDELLGLWFNWTGLLLTPHASNNGETGHQIEVDTADPNQGNGKGKERQSQASTAMDLDVETRLQAKQKPVKQGSVAVVDTEKTNTLALEKQAKAFMEALVGDEMLF